MMRSVSNDLPPKYPNITNNRDPSPQQYTLSPTNNPVASDRIELEIKTQMGQAKQELLYLSNEISNKFKSEVREASEITSKIKSLHSKIDHIDWALN